MRVITSLLQFNIREGYFTHRKRETSLSFFERQVNTNVARYQ